MGRLLLFGLEEPSWLQLPKETWKRNACTTNKSCGNTVFPLHVFFHVA